MSEYMAPAEDWKPEKKEEGCTVNISVNCCKEEKKCYGKYDKKECECNVNITVNCGEEKKWEGCEKWEKDGCTVNIIINCQEKKGPRCD